MSKKTANQTPQADLFEAPASFEAAIAELESLVDAMDGQNVGLDQLVKDYKRGAQLVKYCRDRLQQVRQEVANIEGSLQADNTGGVV